MAINKIITSVDQNYRLKSFDTASLKLINYNQYKYSQS